jgi:hypothetical protein
VVVRAQRAHQCQRLRADLPTGHACGQRRPVRLSAARATSGIAAVFVDLRLDRRHIEELVAIRLVGDIGQRRTAVAELDRRAVGDWVDLQFIEHRPGTALVARLRSALAAAGTPLCPVGTGRAVRGRQLGRVLGVQAQPLLQHGQLLVLQGELLSQQIDLVGQQVNHDMALRHRVRIGWDIGINHLPDIMGITRHEAK